MKEIRILITLLTLSLCATLSAQEEESKWYDHINLSGFGMLQFQTSNADGSYDNTFNIRMLCLALDGTITPQFYYKAQMLVSGSSSTLLTAPRLVDFYLQWQRYKAFKIRIGEMITPFTFETSIHPVDVGFMANSTAVTCLAGGNDRTGMHPSGGRDIGIMIHGDILFARDGRSMLYYALAVVNGQGINVRDVDKKKNLVGQLWVSPFKGMRIGGSAWLGSYARKGTWNDEVSGASMSGVRSLNQFRYAMGFDYDNAGWRVRSEYIHATGEAFAREMINTHDPSASDCTLSDMGNKADGFYVLMIAPVKREKWNIKARYDLYRCSSDWIRSKGIYEVGIDYLVNKHIRFSAEYVVVNDRNRPHPNYHMIDLQSVIRF